MEYETISDPKVSRPGAEERSSLSSDESSAEKEFNEVLESKSAWEDLLDWFIPPSHRSDPEKYRRSLILVRGAPIFWAGSLFFVTVFALQGTLPPTASLGVIVAATLMLLIPLLLKLSGSLVLTSLVLLAVMILGLVYQASIDAGIRDPSLLIMLLFPWLAALLLGPWGGIACGLLVAMVFGAFYVLHQHGLAMENFTPERTHWWFQLIFGSSVAILVGVMGWLYESRRRRFTKALERQRTATRVAVQSLKMQLAREEEVRKALSKMPVPALLLDSAGEVLFVNPEGENLLEGGMGERHGEAWRLSGEGAAFLKAGIEKARRQQQPVGLETFYDPLSRWFEIHVAPAGDHLSVCLLDTTESRTERAELEKTKKEAEEEARRKRRRMEHLSRKIRAEVADVAGLASALSSEQESTEAGHEYGTLIAERAASMLETLNVVHELNTLESREIRAKPVQVDVSEVVQDAVHTVLPLAQGKGLHVWVEPNKPQMWAFVDPQFLSRTVVLLLELVIAQTGSGNITVEVERQEGSIVVRVKDNGGGIEEDVRLSNGVDEAEDPFAGEEEEFDRLRLSVVRRLADLMGASLSIDAEPGLGNTFSILLPASPPDPSDVGNSVSDSFRR